jgi:hypothetical protein
MPLEIEVLTEHVDRFPCREYQVEVTFPTLLLLVVRQYRHVVLGQLHESVEE